MRKMGLSSGGCNGGSSVEGLIVKNLQRYFPPSVLEAVADLFVRPSAPMRLMGRERCGSLKELLNAAISLFRVEGKAAAKEYTVYMYTLIYGSMYLCMEIGCDKYRHRNQGHRA